MPLFQKLIWQTCTFKMFDVGKSEVAGLVSQFHECFESEIKTEDRSRITC